MSLALRPYLNYRESGVAWLGSVPEHWTVRRLKSTVKVSRNGIWGDDPDGHEDIWCVRVADFDRVQLRVKDQRKTYRSVSASERNGRLLEPGDLLLEKSGGGERQPVGAVMMFDHSTEAVCSNFVARISLSPGHDPRFMTYVHFALYNSGINVQSIKQTTGIQNLDEAAYFSESIAIPPLEEQKSIAAFLDHVSVKVLRFIRAKRRLIDLLNEQKQAIIHQAVTRGLDPNVPLKPSGMDWLGDIPAHWEVLPFIRCATERSDYRGATPEKVDSGVLLITAKNIRMGWIDYDASREYVRPDQYEQIMRRGKPKIGDLLFTTEAPLGNVALVDREDIALAQRVIRFRFDDAKMISSFALLSLQSNFFQSQLRLRATGSTAEGIKASKLPQLIVIRPPMREQLHIVASVDSALQRYEQSTAKARVEINLIREYRTRLISDVVTGKIDVRNAAPADLPPFDDEPFDGMSDAGEPDGTDDQAENADLD